MNLINAVWGTCSFELRRSFTIRRSAVTAMFALFPPTMLSLLLLSRSIAEGGEIPEEMQEFSTLLTLFLVSIVLLLSLLLWATPNIHSEIEGKSWTFIASRPGGRVSLFLGKYLASVLVAFGISLIATTACVLIQYFVLQTSDTLRIWLAMNLVFFLASMVYSALFSMLGTLFIKRAMLVGAGVVLGFDVILLTIQNSIINKLTIRHQLIETGLHFIGWFFPKSMFSASDFQEFFGEPWPVAANLTAILLATLVFLAIGSYIVVSREFAIADET